MGSLRCCLLVVVLAGAGACAGSQKTTTTTASPSPQIAIATASAGPACGSATPAQTEGPFYKAGPPEKKTLVESGMPGTKLTLEGFVRDTSCVAIPNARVDFWQADSKGVYDDQGYRLRGYQLTNAQGGYHLETVVPGEYPGRTPHIHVKVTPPGGATVTTQLYMPGLASNNRDGIYTPATVMSVKNLSGGKAATFDFVVPR